MRDPIWNQAAAPEQACIGASEAKRLRDLRIEAGAIRTRVAVAVFALLDALAETTSTMKESIDFLAQTSAPDVEAGFGDALSPFTRRVH